MNQADFQQLTVGVQGMTCASCVGRVERSLRKLDGVLDASVNLATEKATVTLDGAKVQPGSVLATIEGSGYTPVTAHASLAVRGMTCANCRSEEHTSELQSRGHLVCRLLLEKKK